MTYPLDQCVYKSLSHRTYLANIESFKMKAMNLMSRYMHPLHSVSFCSILFATPLFILL
jgi:hypothetical protein